MKLAEALVERKALQEKVTRLRARLVTNARVQEGDAAVEAPTTLLAELSETIGALERLIVSINRTNVTAALLDEPGLSLMVAVARRDMLKLRFAALQELAAAAVPSQNRFVITRSEVKFRPTVDVAALQKQVDEAAKEIRVLDARLQAANWAIDLAE